MAAGECCDELVYAIIGNIPPEYHSSDLRNYFSQFIEGKGFHCFHFRHRPEKRKDDVGLVPVEISQETTTTVMSSTLTTASSSGIAQNQTDDKPQKKKKTTCCVVHLRESKLRELISMYHKKHWLDKNGESISSLCIISKVKVSDTFSASTNIGTNKRKNSGKETDMKVYKTRQEQKKIPPNREEFTADDLNKLAELHPPDIMPSGNVGTPTMVFLDFIRQCRLPPVVIKKLGLSFPKTRTNKKYGSVPFDYGGAIEESTTTDDEEIVVKSGDGKEIIPERETGETESRLKYPENSPEASEKSVKSRLKAEKRERKKLMEEQIEEKMIAKSDESEEDNDSCEEWERHEALCDDPSNQERNKERLFEEEIELKWEKGGSGLVFYTDAQFWDAKEGDFDEKTADNWDVDMSVYYDSNGGDMDSRDYVKMRREERLRNGTDEADMKTSGIGKFEKHTRGFGRRILTKQGWKDGEGLGSTITGIAEALENEGQNPKDRKGFGYRGEKLVRYAGTKRRAQKDVIISTIYDDPSETDPSDPLLRRHEPYGLKYREKVPFLKATQSDTD